jgi:hypothetical protein
MTTSTDSPAQPIRVNASSPWLFGPRFWLLCAVQIWLTHALAFFAYEYAHSFAAWALECKSNPFDLTYGNLSISNVLIQMKIEENVDYGPIFSQGHGHVAALIALAGMGIGNGLLYVVCLGLLRRRALRRAPVTIMFVFWLCLMTLGNFYDYVPIRTFASHGDMAYVNRGLGISPWLSLTVLGIPIAWAIWQFFIKLLPETMQFVFPDQLDKQKALAVISVLIMFGFYGGVGCSGYGSAARMLSIISRIAIFPAAFAYRRRFQNIKS